MEEGQMNKKKKKVMVAIDESEGSRYALEWALQYFHHHLSNPSEVLIFNAQPLADYHHFLYASAFGFTSPELLTTIRAKKRETSTALLEIAKNICHKNGIGAHTVAEVGDPKVAICETVEKLQIDLLVVAGSQRGQQGAVKRAFRGSVSDYCVQNAKCPVLVVRMKARRE